MIRVIAYDIINGKNTEEVGVFNSVQMTGTELRDDNDEIILHWYDHVWVSIKTGNGWYDWTVEAINEISLRDAASLVQHEAIDDDW